MKSAFVIIFFVWSIFQSKLTHLSYDPENIQLFKDFEKLDYSSFHYHYIKSFDGSEVYFNRFYFLVNNKIHILNSSNSFDIFETMTEYRKTYKVKYELEKFLNQFESCYNSLTLSDFDVVYDYSGTGVNESDIIEVLGDSIFFMSFAYECILPSHPLSGYSNQVFTDLVYEGVSDSPFLHAFIYKHPTCIVHEQAFNDLKKGYEAITGERLSFPYFLRVLLPAIYSNNPEVSKFAKRCFIALGGAALQKDKVFLRLDVWAATGICLLYTSDAADD